MPLAEVLACAVSDAEALSEMHGKQHVLRVLSHHNLNVDSLGEGETEVEELIRFLSSKRQNGQAVTMYKAAINTWLKVKVSKDSRPCTTVLLSHPAIDIACCAVCSDTLDVQHTLYCMHIVALSHSADKVLCLSGFQQIASKQRDKEGQHQALLLWTELRG